LLDPAPPYQDPFKLWAAGAGASVSLDLLHEKNKRMLREIMLRVNFIVKFLIS
jgi:hypothetical protein